MKVLGIGKVLAAFLSLVIASSITAQDAATASYPSRTIRLIVPYAAGGITDSVARIVATQLSERWKQPVVVENRTGAGGVIGNNLVATAAPDGYTILIGIPQLIQAPFLVPSLPYDVFRDLAPVSILMRTSLALMVPASSPSASVEQFVAMARSSPGKLSYASPGVGTTPHLFGEQFKALNGNLDMIHVPFKGNVQIVPELLGGRIDTAFLDIVAARPQLASGSLRVLAVTGTSRSRLLPAVPTLSELGYSGFEPISWVGAFVPASTPKGIVDKLATELSSILQSPAVIERFDSMGIESAGSSPEAFATLLKTDAPRWGDMIRRAGIKPE